MTKKITIQPIPIIVVDRPRLDENETLKISDTTLMLIKGSTIK